MDDDILTYDQAADGVGDDVISNVELGDYVEVRLDTDGVIDTVDENHHCYNCFCNPGCNDGPAAPRFRSTAFWYKVTADTLVFDDVTLGVVGADTVQYTSDDFDEANLIDVRRHPWR